MSFQSQEMLFFSPAEEHLLLLYSLLFLHYLFCFTLSRAPSAQTGFPLLEHNVYYFLLVYFTFISVQCILRNNIKLIFDISKFVLPSVVLVLLSNAFKGDFYFYYCILLFYKYLPHYSFPHPILILFSSILSQKTHQLLNIYILFLSPFEVLFYIVGFLV